MINKIGESLVEHLAFLKNLEMNLIREGIYTKKDENWKLNEDKLQ